MEDLDTIEPAPLESPLTSHSPPASIESPPGSFLHSNLMSLKPILKVIWDSLENNSTAHYCWRCSKRQEEKTLIRACKCKGYREFMHASCLQDYVRNFHIQKCIRCNFNFPVQRNVTSWLQEFRKKGSSKFSLLRDLGKYLCYTFGMLIFSTLITIGIGFFIYFIALYAEAPELRTVMLGAFTGPFLFAAFYYYYKFFAKLWEYIKKLLEYDETWELNYILLKEDYYTETNM